MSLELLLAVSQNSSITRFVSMGKNGHRLLKSATFKFHLSHYVSSSCVHPHSAMQWGFELDMARHLDEMASQLTGQNIHSQENHYNKHRDEYDVLCRTFEYSNLSRNTFNALLFNLIFFINNITIIFPKFFTFLP